MFDTNEHRHHTKLLGHGHGKMFIFCFMLLQTLGRQRTCACVWEENCLRRKYGHWGYKNTIMLLWLLAGICLPYSEFCWCTKNHRSESHWARTQGYSFPICKLQIGGTNQTKLDTFALQIISLSKLTKGLSKLQNKIVHPRRWIIWFIGSWTIELYQPRNRWCVHQLCLNHCVF